MDNNLKDIDILEMLHAFQTEKMNTDSIHPSILPNIDLYMDQVTTFMDEHLQTTKRHPEDKILTKTMINNYAKSKVLPPPEKKKYSKDHMLLLTLIYYFKNFLSINDIQTLLEPLNDKFFKSESPLDLSNIYSDIFDIQKAQLDNLFNDMIQKYEASEKVFADAPGEDQSLLSIFSYICTLSYDIYLKKQMVERIIDELGARAEASRLQEKKDLKEKKSKL